MEIELGYLLTIVLGSFGAWIVYAIKTHEVKNG